MPDLMNKRVSSDLDVMNAPSDLFYGTGGRGKGGAFKVSSIRRLHHVLSLHIMKLQTLWIFLARPVNKHL